LPKKEPKKSSLTILVHPSRFQY